MCMHVCMIGLGHCGSISGAEREGIPAIGRPAGAAIQRPAGRGTGTSAMSARPVAHFWSVPYLKKCLEF